MTIFQKLCHFCKNKKKNVYFSEIALSTVFDCFRLFRLLSTVIDFIRLYSTVFDCIRMIFDQSVSVKRSELIENRYRLITKNTRECPQ